jgi:hypothetical protein
MCDLHCVGCDPGPQETPEASVQQQEFSVILTSMWAPLPDRFPFLRTAAAPRVEVYRAGLDL